MKDFLITAAIRWDDLVALFLVVMAGLGVYWRWQNEQKHSRGPRKRRSRGPRKP